MKSIISILESKKYGHIILSYAAIILSVLVFQFQGNASSVAMEGKSIFSWIAHQWTASGGDFSHGWLMPLISIYVIYLKRKELLQEKKTISVIGLFMFAGTCLMHWVAYRAQQPRLSLVAFTGMLFAIPWAICGWKTARHLLFPVGYLLLAFTSYYLVSLTFRLRLLSSAISAITLNGIGIATIRNGTGIHSAAAGGFVFNVADPCSGLRSLVVMVALAAPYAYFTQQSLIKKWGLFCLSVPLAVIGNSLRIVTVAIVAEIWGSEFALKIWHDFSGFLLFAISAFLMVTVGAIVNIDFGKKIEAWKENI